MSANNQPKICIKLLRDIKTDALLIYIKTVIEELLENIENDKYKIDCILVDEVQFMKSEQIDELFQIAIKLDIPIICYGLRTDFKRNGFEGSTRLLLLAHSIEEMKTICACGQKAIFNGRKINGKFVFEGEQIAIDEQDDVRYESLCGDCYYKYRGHSNK